MISTVVSILPSTVKDFRAFSRDLLSEHLANLMLIEVMQV